MRLEPKRLSPTVSDSRLPFGLPTYLKNRQCSISPKPPVFRLVTCRSYVTQSAEQPNVEGGWSQPAIATCRPTYNYKTLNYRKEIGNALFKSPGHQTWQPSATQTGVTTFSSPETCHIHNVHRQKLFGLRILGTVMKLDQLIYRNDTERQTRSDNISRCWEVPAEPSAWPTGIGTER